MLLIGAAAPAQPSPDVPPSPYFIQLDHIVRLECNDVAGIGGRFGTGVRIDATQVLTADHVVHGATCSIAGEPTEIIHEDGALDIAVLRTAPTGGTRAPVSCAGIQTGRTYFAVGYAFGRDFVVQRVTGTDGRGRGDFAGEAFVRGIVHPGQSGGPVFDENGSLVAIVNAGLRDGRQLALVRMIRDTYLCPATNHA